MGQSLPSYIFDAIKCGSVPELRDWQHLPLDDLTTGESVLRFAADYLHFPEGKMAGQPLILAEWQQVFVLAAFDEEFGHVYKAILSVARRCGKTLVMAVICLAYIIGPLARTNTLVRSAAMTRDQAALLFRLMDLILRFSPEVEGLYRTVISGKTIVGLSKNVEYKALSRDAKSGHGQGIYALVVDEAGQIAAANDDFLDMIMSSMGSYDDSKVFIISTQAPTDVAFLSQEIDSATREQPKDVVCHLYTALSDDITDENNWLLANPALRLGYRSVDDIRRKATEALNLPAKANGFLNLYLNRRVSLEKLWIAPDIWRSNGEKLVDDEVFKNNICRIGLDLSIKSDLTAAVLAAKDDDGDIHLKTFAFIPDENIEQRSQSDKIPYDAWARDGIIIPVPGKTLSYDWISEYIKVHIFDEEYEVSSIEFDRWRIEQFQSSATRLGIPEIEWNPVGQGYKDMSPRIDAFETMLLESRIRHDNHPVLLMGASSAIVTSDPAGNRKLDKSKTTQKIDGIIAAIMAVHPFVTHEEEFDAYSMIG